MEQARYRIDVYSKERDYRGEAVKGRLVNYGYPVISVRIVDSYLINAELSADDAERVAKALTSRVTQQYTINAHEKPFPFDTAVEIGFLPGVTDNAAHTVRDILADIFKREFDHEKSVFTATTYYICGVSAEDGKKIAYDISNDLINRAKILSANDYSSQGGFGLDIPVVHVKEHPGADTVPLPSNDADLTELGRSGIRDERGCRGPLALDLPSMLNIRAYFHETEKREPTDIELESIAQTWSEHCKHTIFAAEIDGNEDGVFKTYIREATREIIRRRNDNFCISIFEDNAGGIEFDENYMVSDKVETHNSPSALDPFGGSITGIVGVNRDEMGFGLGAKPIANRYGFCFAEPEDDKPLYRGKDESTRMLSPRRIMEGVVAGVNSGGNCSGIPTPQGFVYFDKRYKGKPLVFVGTIGLLPKKINGKASHIKKALPGDLVVVAGGRVGLDGIHGATFSSEALTEGSPAGAVQIGDPITQKKMSDAIVKEARDRGLYNSITDNGAGGISCSVAEMAKEAGGFIVDLEKVPLKYPGLAPWQIWVSESQERMTFSASPDQAEKLIELFKSRGVEATVIGHFTSETRAIVRFKGETIFNLEMDFLHNGLPKKKLTTNFKPLAKAQTVLPEAKNLGETLKQMLKRLNLAGYEFISKQFDHEVLGNSCTKPLQGKGRVNAPATVIKPLFESNKGVVLSQSLYPSYAEIDPYRMALATIDTAIRSAVVAGSDPDRIAILDNFCWCDSLNPLRLGQLKEAAQGCYDGAVAFNAPFVSGKDSMFNDFKGYDENFNEVKISVPPTLLISAIGIAPDVHVSQTIDFKGDGYNIYLIGETAKELWGSEYFAFLAENGVTADGGAVPAADGKYLLGVYRRYHDALKKNLIASAVPLERAGLAYALARSAMAGMVGAEVDLANVKTSDSLTADELLYSETQGRILVSVRSDKAEAFEKELSGDAVLIGRTGGKALVVKSAAAEIINESIDTLLSCYRERLAKY